MKWLKTLIFELSHECFGTEHNFETAEDIVHELSFLYWNKAPIKSIAKIMILFCFLSACHTRNGDMWQQPKGVTTLQSMMNAKLSQQRF